MTTAGEMRERVGVLSLVYDQEADEYRWEEARRVWTHAELDTRSNLFSSVGIGARGVTFTLRRGGGLDLNQAFSWNGQHPQACLTCCCGPICRTCGVSCRRSRWR